MKGKKRRRRVDRSKISVKAFIDEGGAEIYIHVEGRCDLKDCQRVFNNVIKKLTFKRDRGERDFMFA